ncbi:MAG: hypothetical protein OXI88_00445 [Gammaproteobacteria bacterium]|nr:hypothetical protein [Gammaproteobacteria bacterium]
MLPVAGRLSLLQSARVRVCVKVFPLHTVPTPGDQALTGHFFTGGSGLQGPLSTLRARV